MNIYIIRHAEPDYERDSLTEKGWREAEFLSRRLSKIENASYYTSPLGRAKDTASLTLQAVGKEAEVFPWLREFDKGYTVPPEFNPKGFGWDFPPQLWTSDPAYYDPERWLSAPAYRNSGIEPVYRAVTDGLDALIARHGYERGDHVYKVVRPNTENILIFCHFGVECVLLSRLFDCSPVTLWHHTVALPSSVTVVTTEEREKGTAVFRMSRFGDLSHLDANEEAPSFCARFCERNGDGTRETW